ncbi:aspartic peptidase domain-containing protein [Trametes maxima]|nr:aspartic peptidase domain-containing protein [Trametes maxima]
MLRLSLLLLPLYVTTTYAFRAPIEVSGRRMHVPRQAGTHVVSASRNPGSSAAFNFSHASDQEYTMTLKVNGVPFQLVLDTGSSDTWIDPVPQGVEPTGMFYTGRNSTTSYADGTVSSGPIMLADLDFGPYHISNQAIMVSYNGTPAPDLFQGIVGIARTPSSEIHGILSNGTPYADNARPPLINIFESLTDQPNYITFLLGRDEIGISAGGVFTVSELVTEYAAVTSTPKLEVFGSFGWLTALDGLYVNGKLLNGHSSQKQVVEQALNITFPEGTTLAELDTGTSYGRQLQADTRGKCLRRGETVRGPKYYVDAIYKDIPGAFLTDNADGANGYGYVVPCDTKLNISFVFNGQQYPMHPIDVTVAKVADNGTVYCNGAFSANPGGVDYQEGSTQDWLIGDSFLRNVYSLWDCGKDTDPTDGKAYMQLLSILQPDAVWAELDELLSKRTAAHQSFFTATHGAKPTTTQYAWTGSTSMVSVTAADNKQTFSPPPSSQRIAGALSEDDTATNGINRARLEGLVRDTNVIIGLLAGVLVMLVVVIVFVARANRTNKTYRAIPLQ